MSESKKNSFKRYLFNFSSSYTGGGLKRLLAYVEWFDEEGGAHFIVNKKLKGKLDKFQDNTFHYVELSPLQKLINTQEYVNQVIKLMGECDFYYSYNIPLKNNLARKKWFHISNVLPFLSMSKFGIPLRRRIELWWLGVLIKRGFRYAHYISAESSYSLTLLNLGSDKNLQVSVNGSDEEIELNLNTNFSDNDKDLAVIVGTYYYKNLEDSYQIFRQLKSKNHKLKLVIIGDIDTIPKIIRDDPEVILKGVVDHETTIATLTNSKYYINTSKVENSWNAASEGVFLAKESFISDIPPHRELLQTSSIEFLNKTNTFHSIIHVSRDNFRSDNLKTWGEVISSMKKIIQ